MRFPFALVMLDRPHCPDPLAVPQPGHPELRRHVPCVDVTKDNITDVFMGYFGSDTDPRLKEILKSLVTHLHDFRAGDQPHSRRMAQGN